MRDALYAADLLVHRALHAQPTAHRVLLEAFDDSDAILGASDAALTLSGVDSRTVRALRERSADKAWLQRALEWLQAPGHSLIRWSEPAYPPQLAVINDAPMLLFCVGDVVTLSRDSVAIVGSRAATPAGLEAEALLARELASAGLSIVSGMALGIDAQAQSACVEGGFGTVAVLGTGVDVVHPKRHSRLADRISATGVLFSEFPLGTPARPGNFPRRNRVISGLSRATLVVEAAEKSGTLNTARLALEQGRDVFAIPGSIFSRRSEGCHALIRDGAALVRTPADVLGELGVLVGQVVRSGDEGPLPDDQKRLVEVMRDAPRTIDELAGLTGLSHAVLAAALTELEIAGRVRTEGATFLAVST